MPTFREKPVEIEAVQLTWQTWSDICDLVGEFPPGMTGVAVDPVTGKTDKVCAYPFTEIGLLIPTLEGTMLGRENDWIIRGIQGEFYPCKNDIFVATYEAR